MTQAAVTIEKKVVPGASYRVDAAYPLSTSYPHTAGYVLTPATFNLNRISSLAVAFVKTGLYTPTIVPTYSTDGSNTITSAVLRLIVNSTGSEVADTVDVSAETITFMMYGS